MRILLSSYAFSPSLGGIESSSALLAGEFSRRGHAVTVITETSGPDHAEWPFPVVRRPRGRRLLSLVRECDVFFHNNISLRAAWPLLLVRRPWVVTHQTWMTGRAKRWACRGAVNVAISEAVAHTLPCEATRIGNPYDDQTFRPLPEIPRDRELVFLGRLVSDKGADLLLRALALLATRGLRPKLTIAGSGPEEPGLRQLTQDLALADQVQFSGPKRGSALAELLHRHRLMVVPSRWEEPFGIVALEGLACGCVVVGSSGGGLPEAIGPCGRTFPNGDAVALAESIEGLLQKPAELEGFLQLASVHLRRFTAAAVADAYLRLFTGLLSS